MPNDLIKPEEVGDKVLGLALVGVPLHEILKKLVKAGAEEVAVRESYARTLEYFRHVAASDRVVDRGQAAARLNLLFLSAMKVQDYKTALSVQKELNKLSGLYDGAPTQQPAPVAVSSSPVSAEEDLDALASRLLLLE